MKKKVWLSWLLIAAGAAASAIAMNLLLIPNNVAPGGFTGIATVLHLKLGFPFGITLLAMNLPLFVLAWKHVGREYFFKSLFGLGMYSLAADLIVLPAFKVDPMLASIFGGILLGAGMGFILRAGGSTGGTDIAASLLRTRIGMEMPLGRIILVIDAIVVIGSGVFLGPEEALYALVTVFVCTKVIDLILAPVRAKAFFIITGEADKLKADIMHTMRRGVTEVSGRGGYTGAEHSVLLCVVEGRSQFMALKALIKQADPRAFMISVDASEVLGEGFSG